MHILDCGGMVQSVGCHEALSLGMKGTRIAESIFKALCKPPYGQDNYFLTLYFSNYYIS